MAWPQINGKVSLLSQILRLENAFYEYDKLGSKLAEELRTAVLLRTEQMVLGTSMAADTSAPMQVDRIQKGKGAGKKGQGKKGEHQKGAYNNFKGQPKGDLKGKGKFYDKGKGKTKNSKSNDGKGYDQKGHGKHWSDHSKGKGYGQGKGRGDGGKGNQQSIQCWHCGGNHKAANCWKGNHVRQVLDGQEPQQQQQQQSTGPSQSSQSQHASSSAAPATASATTYRVMLISQTCVFVL